MATKSDNVVVRTIINIDIGGFHSVIGRNLGLMQTRFNMEEICVRIMESYIM